WLPLGELYARVKRGNEAGICLLNALWNPAKAPAEWAWNLFILEARSAAEHHKDASKAGRFWAAKAVETAPAPQLGGDDLNPLLALAEPAVADMRALAAYLVWCARRAPHSPALVERLNPLHRFLEAHERLLPVRAVWLAWYHLVQLSGGDIL